MSKDKYTFSSDENAKRSNSSGGGGYDDALNQFNNNNNHTNNFNDNSRNKRYSLGYLLKIYNINLLYVMFLLLL